MNEFITIADNFARVYHKCSVLNFLFVALTLFVSLLFSVEFLPRSGLGDGPLAAFGGPDGVIRVLSMQNWLVHTTNLFPSNAQYHGQVSLGFTKIKFSYQSSFYFTIGSFVSV